MSIAAGARPLPDSNPDLVEVATYRRRVQAGIARIWENVFDWEHLPVLHESQFNRVELQAIGSWGWRIRLYKQPGDPARLLQLELSVDRPGGRYCVSTLAGTGAGSQIWTALTPVAAQQTDIEVRYLLPEIRPERLEMLGTMYRSSCARLWDEDERMMRRREACQALPPAPARFAPMPLGPLAALRQRLPLLLELGGWPFRLLEVDGELVIHAAVCPHWHGPLDAAAVENGQLRCPWHGYRFDVRTGASADGRGLQLAAAPRIVIDPMTSEVMLVPAADS